VSWRIPLIDVAMPEEDVEAVLETLRSGWLTMGPRTQEFERAFADYVGTQHAVAVSSGTAALHLACSAVELGPGDEAIVPAMTFAATASAVRYTGADAVFCDVRAPDDPQIDPDDVARRLTPRTKAVLAVHLFGYPAAVQELRALCDERGLTLIEDAAQAVGATVDGSGRRTGTVGRLGCFSFFSKNQLCVGEGGMVTTDDADLAARVRSLRSHAMTSVTWDRHRGHEDSYDVTGIGFNFRLDEPRASLGLSRLPRLERELAARRDAVRAYRSRLSGVPGLGLMFDDEAVERSSHFGFPVLLPDRAARDAFRDGLHRRGVQTTWYPAVHLFSDYRSLYPELSLPRAEEVADRHCVLPLSSTFSGTEVEIVAEVVEETLVGDRLVPDR
jgi:dTDP-4-amino-4,6-dideoxygalactose transaminase